MKRSRYCVAKKTTKTNYKKKLKIRVVEHRFYDVVHICTDKIRGNQAIIYTVGQNTVIFLLSNPTVLYDTHMSYSICI